jgi:hypothetical protein
MIGVSLVIGIISLILIANTVNIIKENERVVIYRLGKFSEVKGPGLVLIIPFLDKLMKIELGKVGNALSDIDLYQGEISINGEEYEAFCEGKIKKGEKIKIVGLEEKVQFTSEGEVKKLKIKVKKKEV